MSSTTRRPEDDINNMDIRLGGALVSMNPFKHNNSASRVSMDASHISQAVVLPNAERMSISTGMDYNYADYTFDIKIKGEEGQTARILGVTKRYSRMGSHLSVNHNPEYFVLYEILETGVIDVSVVPTYCFQHTTFGFMYKFTDAFSRLKEGDLVPCGTLLAHSAGLDVDNQVYQFGINAVSVFGSFPEVIEDGIAISESFSKKMGAHRFGTLTVNYGQNAYLLNLYGDEDHYKAFPDIGETIREDGLVFASRNIDPILSPVQMTPHALMDIDYTFDKLFYAIPGAKVEDIIVYHSHDTSKYYLPTGMKDQPEKYYQNNDKFYRDMEAFYSKVKHKKSKTLNLSPELHHLITSGMKLDHRNLKRANRTTYRKEDIQQYRVTIVYSYLEPMHYGAKAVGCSGDKGVICHILPDEMMPMTKDGLRAEILLDSALN